MPKVFKGLIVKHDIGIEDFNFYYLLHTLLKDTAKIILKFGIGFLWLGIQHSGRKYILNISFH